MVFSAADRVVSISDCDLLLKSVQVGWRIIVNMVACLDKALECLHDKVEISDNQVSLASN